MKLRTAQLPSSFGASYGKVRNWNAQQHAFSKTHQGWDLEAAIGTPCRAIADGLIHYVGHHPQFGLQVILQFSRSGNPRQSIPGDTFFAHYAHLSAAGIAAGTAVRAGDVVGWTGVSGNASPKAPHLHFEIREMAAINPGLGLTGRLDPAQFLGYQYLVSSEGPI
jgi:murein DD-endopeptidase MepM/ murein hydrolase activator NlpD